MGRSRTSRVKASAPATKVLAGAYCLLALTAAWAAAVLFHVGGSPGTQWLRLVVIEPAACVGVGVGFVAARLLQRASRNAALVLSAWVVGAGAALGTLASVAGLGSGECLHGTLLGVATAVAVLPALLLTFVACRRAARSRVGSVIEAIDRRAVVTVVATAVALEVLAASPSWLDDLPDLPAGSDDGPKVFALLAITVLASVLVLDVQALRRTRGAAGRVAGMVACADAAAPKGRYFDVGIGDEQYALLGPSASTPYRERRAKLLLPRGVIGVRGEPSLGTGIAKTALLRDAAALIAAMGALALVELMDPAPFAGQLLRGEAAEAGAPAKLRLPRPPSDYMVVNPDGPYVYVAPPKKPTGKVSFGSVSLSSGTDADARMVVYSLMRGFRECYENGLSERPGMTGTMRVDAVLGQTGDVLSTKPRATGSLTGTVVACVAERARSASFAPQPAGGAKLTLFLSFEPE